MYGDYEHAKAQGVIEVENILRKRGIDGFQVWNTGGNIMHGVVPLVSTDNGVTCWVGFCQDGVFVMGDYSEETGINGDLPAFEIELGGDAHSVYADAVMRALAAWKSWRASAVEISCPCCGNNLVAFSDGATIEHDTAKDTYCVTVGNASAVFSTLDDAAGCLFALHSIHNLLTKAEG